MSDLTDAQKVERARRAEMALDEFLDPAFQAVIDTYSARLEDIASKQPWEATKITALANATRIAKEVQGQIKLLVYEGQEARRKIVRAEEIEKLSPAKRRFLNMVPH